MAAAIATAPALPARGELARPDWLPDFVPALNGLRGLAILMVLIQHCLTEFTVLKLGWMARWGWTGVNLFFVLSGFLITGIILDGRQDPHFFRNFYTRRALRIWPVYFLLLPVAFLLFGGKGMWLAPSHLPLTYKGVPWLYFIFFLQNLVPGMTGAIYPTWSLAIEEQFYLLWAPVARNLNRVALGVVLVAAVYVSIWTRQHMTGQLTPINSLGKLDGLAVGSGIALGMRVWRSRRLWQRLSAVAMVFGTAGCIYARYRGGAYFDAALAAAYGGMLVAAVLTATRANRYGRVLGWAPLRGLGVISYALYLFHMPVFAEMGAFDKRMAPHGAWGVLAIVALRWTVSIVLATLSWRFFESPILRLKRRFQPPAPKRAAAPAAG